MPFAGPSHECPRSVVVGEMGVDGAGEDGGEQGDEKADEGEYGGCDVEKVDFRSRRREQSSGQIGDARD